MFTVSLPPHIGTGQKLGRWQKVKASAVLPPLLAALYLHPALFGMAFTAALLGHALPALLRMKWRYCRDNWGECLYGAALIALLMPVQAPWYYPLAAGLLASAGRLLFSEPDYQPPLNFTALVMAIFILATPERIGLAFQWTWDSGGWAAGNFHFLTGWLPYLLALLILAIPGRGLFKMLTVFLTALAAALVLGLNGWFAQPASWNPALQALCFFSVLLASDNPYTPLSRTGQAFYGLMAGGLFGLFAVKGLPYEGMMFPALLAGLFTPALDSLINSRRRRKNF
jgi:Na+-translocating ferredoxin:NAD+ oxidoreductase RnfD subunit